MTTPRYRDTCHSGPGAVSPPSLEVYWVGTVRRGHPGPGQMNVGPLLAGAPELGGVPVRYWLTH